MYTERKAVQLPEAEYVVFKKVDLGPDEGCRVLISISRKDKENAAIDMAARGMIFDEALGICYEAAHRDVSDIFVIVKYYTDIDVGPFDTPDGWIELYDKLRTCDALKHILFITERDVGLLHDIRNRTEAMHTAMFERQHSLAYQIQNALRGVLTPEGQQQVVTEALDVNEFLIDALGLMAGRTVEGTPGKKHAVAGHPLLSFGKREIVSMPSDAGNGG